MAEAWLDELSEWLRIPSVSSDPAHGEDVRRAGEWLCGLVRRAGGDAELADWNGNPLALGEIRASSDAENAPTLLVYGHFDVQPPGPADGWETEPFEPIVRDGWLYARGVADDKGQLYVLIKAAEALRAAGELAVNVRVACDGEEEVSGDSIVDWVSAGDRGADACLIFDAPMVNRSVPAFVVATRGNVYFHLRVRTGERDLHSGLYGGAALNALHALFAALSGLLPVDGRLPEPLRAGVQAPTDEELAEWAGLPPGAGELAGQGARLADGRAGDDFYLRTWAEPSLDIHGIVGGEARLQKTIVPVVAEANVSVRLVPGQSPEEVSAACERLIRSGAPAGAELDLERWSVADAAVFSPEAPAIELAREGFERGFGAKPLLVRSGGTLPIAAALAKRGIPAVITGVALPESNIHAPNERLPVEYVSRGIDAAREIYRALAALR